MLSSSAKVSVRAAVSRDAEPLAGVHERSWRQAYTGIIPFRHLDAMVRRRGTAWWSHAVKAADGLLVVEAAGVVAGYVSFGAIRQPFRPLRAEGEIFELYLDPVYQGLGLGETLFEAARGGLDGQRRAGLIVWVLADNDPAIRFYWARGGRPKARAIDRATGARLPKVGLIWP